MIFWGECRTLVPRCFKNVLTHKSFQVSSFNKNEVIATCMRPCNIVNRHPQVVLIMLANSDSPVPANKLYYINIDWNKGDNRCVDQIHFVQFNTRTIMQLGTDAYYTKSLLSTYEILIKSSFLVVSDMKIIEKERMKYHGFIISTRSLERVTAEATEFLCSVVFHR